MKNNTSINKIICGKFDSCINFPNNSRKKVRIGSHNINKLKKISYEAISTDGNVILFKNKIYNIRDFFNKFEKYIFKNIIVLTMKERDLIIDVLVDYNCDVAVLEIKYPVFNHIKYISNIYQNYEELLKLLKVIEKLNIKGKSLAHHLSTEYLYHIERKLRFKNTLDTYFAFAYKGGYQEVFKLKEKRKDRVILALDFNSMYVDCMLGNFIEPKTIKYENFHNKKIEISELKNGLYRVILKNVKSDFFKKFHPFKYKKLNHSYYFQIEDNHEIEILLFKNEIEYYQTFFENIEIIEGFFSLKSVEHPLKKTAKNIYNDRLKYKEHNNDIMSSLSKYKLITIHSSTNQKRFKVLYFSDIESIVKYIEQNYMISFEKNTNSINNLKSIEDNKYFKFWKYKNGYKIKVINFNVNETIYSISAQILANSRLKMVKTIEKFLSYNSVELCYTNIDSIHISILKKEVNNFLKENKNIISNKLGDLKIESISESGYWFDVGRYWLISNRNVDLFKNTFFNTRNQKNMFIKNNKIKIMKKNDFINYVKIKYNNIYKSFSYHKKVDYNTSTNDKYNFKRYNFREIENISVANDSYSEEILKSKKLKVDLFNDISTV